MLDSAIMAYTVRFESNALAEDNKIRQLIDALGKLGKNVKKLSGIKIKETQVNELKKLYGVNQRTFTRAMDWAENDFDQQITNIQWDWKGPEGKTRRKNGQVVDEPRDIVDQGTLLNSKQRENIGQSVTEFTWTANHAEGVHDGYQAKGGGMNPARPWTEQTIEDIDEVIQTILDRESGGVIKMYGNLARQSNLPGT